MKKYTNKILAIIMTMILVFSVVAFDGVFAADKLTFSLSRVSETDTQVVVSVNLESGKFNSATFQVNASVNLKECSKIERGEVLKDYVVNGGEGTASMSNPKTNQATIASATELSNPGSYFLFTFDKVKADRVQAEDFSLIEKDIEEELEIVNNLPSKFSVDSLTYSVVGSNVTITKCRTDAFGAATIPATINGKTVTVIAADAFADCDELDSIVIPAGVTFVGENAFKNCSSVKSITISKNLKLIGEDAFDGCTGLETATFTGSIADWCAINFKNANSNAGKFAKTLKIGGSEVKGDVVIPDTVNSIGKYAFMNRKEITTLTLGENVAAVGENAFSGCETLEMVIIPKTTTSIADNAFADCAKIAKVGYKSGADDWKNVVIGENNDALKNAEITYYYGHAHDFKTVVETVKATCTTDGYTVYKCTMCEETQTGDIVKATGHQAKEWKYDTQKHWKICEIEGEKFAEAEHTFDANGGCECGYIKALMGDLNNDGKINSLDALLLLQFVVGQVNPNSTQKTLADTNKDGKYDSTDALRILQYTVGMIDKLG